MGCKNAVVAHAMIIDATPAIEHESLTDHLQVQIYKVIDDFASLPVPVKENDMFTVAEADGVVIYWPKDLVVFKNGVI